MLTNCMAVVEPFILFHFYVLIIGMVCNKVGYNNRQVGRKVIPLCRPTDAPYQPQTGRGGVIRYELVTKIRYVTGIRELARPNYKKVLYVQYQYHSTC